MSEPVVLGIESSCDETGVGIVRGTELLANAVASSVEQHARFGGVVPEVASRAHLEAMVPTLEQAYAEAGLRVQDVDAIAVTCGPGLTGALLVGVAAAKALALAHDKPLYGVNHLVAHVAVDQLEHGRLDQRVGALLVSGGHTEILLVDDIADDVTMLGSTIDDAAGEAFDKVARLLGLPYPGGPHIDREARDGDGSAIDFPRGLTRAARPGAAPLRLLVLRAEERRGPPRAARGAHGPVGVGPRRRRLVPGRRVRRADPQDRRGVPGARRRHAAGRRRRGRQRPAAHA